MKSKDKPHREPRKEPRRGEEPEPTADERERGRLLSALQESDRLYAEYFATLDPRQQALMPQP